MLMSRKFFGTDGIRGYVGRYPITPDIALKLGWACGEVLCQNKEKAKVIIGKDTRRSCYLLESALSAGLTSAGVDVYLLGPMPTPAVAYLTRTFHASAGIVISASHNPHCDNGIKFFSKDGYKLDDQVELQIESYLEAELQVTEPNLIGSIYRIDDAPGRYIEFTKASIPNSILLKGLKIVLDCANGAAYHIAPAVFKELGADVITIADHPDGLNINDQCGAVYPQRMKEVVLASKADIGIALDGDADRLILCDHTGEIVDGDDILYILAKCLKAHQKLSGGVVGTLMSNFALEKALQKLDIPFERANVGDRYVIEKLKENNWNLGGETSGHIIYLDANTTGDAIVAALQILQVIVTERKTLKQLLEDFHKMPQCMINVPLNQALQDKAWDVINTEVEKVEKILNNQGRVVLRASGTEPLLRVMVEAVDKEQAKAHAKHLSDVVGSFV
ncbi:phosphoglucosamine mutase [Thiotrichales bacterium 19S9-12]|nr:phosphoglucosamine mutase [Thiotrichales bacterium 19S9-11]MCF6810932.1 phosphoglucosamine mutase [Thiotrichales bacterium 19S9-12]